MSSTFNIPVSLRCFGLLEFIFKDGGREIEAAKAHFVSAHIHWDSPIGAI